MRSELRYSIKTEYRSVLYGSPTAVGNGSPVSDIPGSPGCIVEIASVSGWLGGNTREESTTGRIRNTTGRQQAPGYVARGRSGVEDFLDKVKCRYSFHPPTSERLSGGIVLTRLQVKAKGSYVYKAILMAQ